MILRNHNIDILASTQEQKLFQLFRKCVPFTPTKVEVCGSFGLNLFQRFHEKELSYSVPAWNYGDIDIFCCGDNATTVDYMQIIKDFEEKLKLNKYTISCKLTKRFNSKSTGCVDADRVSLRPHLSECDIRLIDYTIEGIPVDISFINMSKTNHIDTVIRSFDLSCCSVSFSCSFSNKYVCDINLTCCQWKKGDLNWEGDSIMGDVSSYDDIIQGNMHPMLTECQNKRVSKYQSRGLKNVINKVKVMKKQINSESKSSTSGPCENSTVSVASVYNDCQNHGALIDVEHNNLAPSNIIDDNVETKAKDIETKATTSGVAPYVWRSGHTPHYLQNMKGREPISINERRGGTKLCQDICWTTSNCWLDQYDMTSKHSKNELHLMTLNCWFIKNGSNFQQIVVEILRVRPICVCLQEVTPTLFAMLAKSDVLRRNGYALFGRMDQDYITTGCSGINYGLAFVTREKLLNYRSVPFTQGENYAMSSPEFERAAYQAEIQHAKSTNKKCQVCLDVDTKCNSENDDASAPLPAKSSLTTQGRYFDIAFAEDFIIVNVHAESLNAGIRRDKQFRAIVEHIRTVTTTNIPVYLCGDLNTTVGSAEEKVLLKYFTDTNVSKSKVNTFLKTNRNYLKYYDRILKFKGTANQSDQCNKINSGVNVKDWTTVDLNKIGQECIFDHKAVHVKVQWK